MYENFTNGTMDSVQRFIQGKYDCAISSSSTHDIFWLTETTLAELHLAEINLEDNHENTRIKAYGICRRNINVMFILWIHSRRRSWQIDRYNKNGRQWHRSRNTINHDLLDRALEDYF